MMTIEQKTIITANWKKVATLDDKLVGSLFYNKLFQLAPEVRTLFSSSVPEQSKKLMAMLHYMVRHINQPDEVSATLSALASRHVKYKVKPYQYAVVGNALLWTLSQGLGSDWNEAAEDAWAAFYTHVSRAMKAVHEAQAALA